MRPTGPQGLIRRRFRIRARAGRAWEAPGAIARSSQRIDMSALLRAAPRSPGIVKATLPAAAHEPLLAETRRAAQGEKYVSKDDVSDGTGLAAARSFTSWWASPPIARGAPSRVPSAHCPP